MNLCISGTNYFGDAVYHNRKDTLYQIKFSRKKEGQMSESEGYRFDLSERGREFDGAADEKDAFLMVGRLRGRKKYI